MPINSRPPSSLLDDDEDSREMLRTLLTFSRIEAKAIATAVPALSLIRAEHFGLYLLEAWLPSFDGFDLCRQMRGLDPHSPILFYSSAAYDADQKRGFEAGATAYVIKPDVDGLLGNITRFVFHPESAAG